MDPESKASIVVRYILLKRGALRGEPGCGARQILVSEDTPPAWTADASGLNGGFDSARRSR